jgi:hypothetical protein
MADTTVTLKLDVEAVLGLLSLAAELADLEPAARAKVLTWLESRSFVLGVDGGADDDALAVLALVRDRVAEERAAAVRAAKVRMDAALLAKRDADREFASAERQFRALRDGVVVSLARKGSA